MVQIRGVHQKCFILFINVKELKLLTIPEMCQRGLVWKAELIGQVGVQIIAGVSFLFSVFFK